MERRVASEGRMKEQRGLLLERGREGMAMLWLLCHYGYSVAHRAAFKTCNSCSLMASVCEGVLHCFERVVCDHLGSKLRAGMYWFLWWVTGSESWGNAQLVRVHTRCGPVTHSCHSFRTRCGPVTHSYHSEHCEAL